MLNLLNMNAAKAIHWEGEKPCAEGSNRPQYGTIST